MNIHHIYIFISYINNNGQANSYINKNGPLQNEQVEKTSFTPIRLLKSFIFFFSFYLKGADPYFIVGFSKEE